MSHVKSPHGASLLAMDRFIVACLVEREARGGYMEIPAGGGKGIAARPPCYAVSYCHPLPLFASSPCHLENPSAGGWTSRLTLTRSPQALSSVLVTALRISVALEMSSLVAPVVVSPPSPTMMMTIDPTTTTNHRSRSMSYTIH